MIIGNLGYPGERLYGKTPVFSLELTTFAISHVQTLGDMPGWIHRHEATLAPDGGSILVTGGELDRGGDAPSLVENIDNWRLHLADMRWERLTKRAWRRWEVRRADGRPNHLFDLHCALWERENPALLGKAADAAIPGMLTLEEELGREPDFEAFKNLYHPAVPHEQVHRDDEESNVRRIRVHGVTVRYVEELYGVQTTVEGDLPEAVIAALKADLINKMYAIENACCNVVDL